MATKQTPTPPVVTPEAIPRPRIQVLERSLQNPFGMPSAPIELREPGLVCHWINTELKGGAQLHYATDAGYLKVKPEYLKNPDVFQFQVSPEGYVTRGQRHQEILMYTTLDHAQARQRAKTDANHRLMSMPTTGMAEAAAKKYGDESADFIHKHAKSIGTVTTEREIIAVDGEDGA